MFSTGIAMIEILRDPIFAEMQKHNSRATIRHARAEMFLTGDRTEAKITRPPALAKYNHGLRGRQREEMCLTGDKTAMKITLVQVRKVRAVVLSQSNPEAKMVTGQGAAMYSTGTGIVKHPHGRKDRKYQMKAGSKDRQSAHNNKIAALNHEAMTTGTRVTKIITAMAGALKDAKVNLLTR